jgi:hypothetical protein
LTGDPGDCSALAIEEIDMKVNVGTMDRIARALLGIALIVAALTGVIGVWGWIGVVPLGTALVSFCPLYAVLGIDSCPASASQQ